MENGDTCAKYLPYMTFTKLFTMYFEKYNHINKTFIFNFIHMLLALLTSKHFFQNQHTQKYLKFVKQILQFHTEYVTVLYFYFIISYKLIISLIIFPKENSYNFGFKDALKNLSVLNILEIFPIFMS